LFYLKAKLNRDRLNLAGGSPDFKDPKVFRGEVKLGKRISLLPFPSEERKSIRIAGVRRRLSPI
jgi:hypothetical protein